MYQKLLNESKSINTAFNDCNKDSYTELFLILHRVNMVVELCRKDVFNADFRHILKSAKIYLKRLPTEQTAKDLDCTVLLRELRYIIPSLVLSIEEFIKL